MQRSEYKLLVENWRSFINEEDVSEESPSKIETIGQLKNEFKKYEKSKTEKALKTLMKNLLLDSIPGGSQVKSLKDFLFKVTKLPDNKRSEIGNLKSFDIDKELEAVLKDDIIDDFILEFSKVIEKFPNNTKIGDLDMNELLGAYIKQTELKQGELNKKFLGMVGN